mgnify:CR=1 FL=1
MSDMSRFHRDTFHPPRADLSPPRPPRVRTSHGKRSGHAPPPWAAKAEPVKGLVDSSTPLQRLAKALRVAGKAAAARAGGASKRRKRGT